MVDIGCCYFDIKNHKFLKGIKFHSLNQIEIPNKKDLKLKAFFKQNKCINNNKEFLNNNNNEQKINNDIRNKLIKEGILCKKSPWFHYNTRRILLYPDKLQYIDPIKNIVKGEIVLNKDTKAIAINDYRFELHTPKRVFIFKVN